MRLRRRSFLKLAGIAIFCPSLPTRQETFVVELLNEDRIPFCGRSIKDSRCFSMMAERRVSEMRLLVEDKVVHTQQIDVQVSRGDTITISFEANFGNKIRSRIKDTKS